MSRASPNRKPAEKAPAVAFSFLPEVHQPHATKRMQRIAWECAGWGILLFFKNSSGHRRRVGTIETSFRTCPRPVSFKHNVYNVQAPIRRRARQGPIAEAIG